MTPTRLFYVLIFSLSLNLGAIGTLAYRHFQDAGLSPRIQPGPPLTVQEICRLVPLQNGQCQQFQRLRPERQRQRRALRMELNMHRRELFQLLKQDHQSWPEIQGKLQEIRAKQEELEAQAVRALMESMQTLTPEQRAAFITLLERRVFPPRGKGRGRSTETRY